MLKFSMLAIVVMLFVLGCQKTSLLDGSGKVFANTEFNAATAKLWYYQYFVNADEARSVGKNKKIPVWKNESYYRVGKFEVIEFPLIMDKKQISVPSALPLADKKKIAAASLSKIKFTKNEKGEIFVTEVTYIPDLVYLQNKNFDISSSGYGKTSDDFNGTMIIKKWNGKILSTNFLRDGKVERNKDLATNAPVNSAGRVEIECSPGYREMCQVQQDCYVDPDGMVISCSEWYLIEGSCYCEVIPGVGGEEPDYCELYGIGCDNGGDDPPPPPPGEPCNAEMASFVSEGSAVSQDINEVTVSNNGIEWNKAYDWKIFSAGTWGLLSYEDAKLTRVQYPNITRWEYQTVTHRLITDVGVSIGGTRTFEDLGPTINISPTRTMVSIRIDFKVTHAIICQYATPPLTIPYNANVSFVAPN